MESHISHLCAGKHFAVWCAIVGLVFYASQRENDREKSYALRPFPCLDLLIAFGHEAPTHETPFDWRRNCYWI
ncbi:MAG TPA: hypothetical protein VJ723_05140, partial [Candidatus Angelobacter sp.]|nr:hypothetical protein [Candidatus Angelobacter sp.]